MFRLTNKLTLAKQQNNQVLRGLATVNKGEGSIADVFASLSGEKAAVLPERFRTLKNDIWKDNLIESWRDVLNELKPAVEETIELGSDVIPRVPFESIKNNNVDQNLINRIKTIGSAVIDGGVPVEQSLKWKQDIIDYANNPTNKDRVKGFPQDDIMVYEFYNTKSQTEARCHPALIESQKFLLNLLSKSDPNSEISLQTLISYYDRLRIRKAGDSKFALGPHIDGGSLERWEDPGYRNCWKNILENNWRSHNPFDISPRLKAKFDLYGAKGGCSVYRPFQGWTSLSYVKPTEGSLRVLGLNLKLATAYIILRPFFRPKKDGTKHLDFNDWELDLDTSKFPGSAPGRTIELPSNEYPHLHLDKTMVSAPKLQPGDQIYWHSDVVHAVESEHKGKNDSSVLYIPAIPLTENNANYLKDQRARFKQGLPPSDFPQGEGESKFVGRQLAEDVKGDNARQLLGLQPFAYPTNVTIGAKRVIDKSNKILFS